VGCRGGAVAAGQLRWLGFGARVEGARGGVCLCMGEGVERGKEGEGEGKL